MFGKTLSAMIDVFATEPQRGVLDLVGMSQPLASLLTLGFDTVRMDESAVWALGHMRSMTKFHSCLVGTRRLVVFETREEFEFGPISRPRLIPPYNVKKYVVNVHTDRAVEHFTTELRSPPPHILLQHFVIIFDPKFVPSKAPRSDDNDPYSGFLFPLLSDNIKLWTAGSKHQLTMVNFPQLKSINPSSFSPHWASAFRPHETFQEFQKCFKLHLITASFWEMFSEKDEFSSASWIESRVSDTRFLTLNEYAAELSTHDFEMETDRSTFKSWIETRQEEFPGDTDLEDLDTDTEDAMSTPGSRQLRRLPAVILSPSFGYLSSSDSNTSLNSLF
jgi:hypothetical protein